MVLLKKKRKIQVCFKEEQTKQQLFITISDVIWYKQVSLLPTQITICLVFFLKPS